MTESTRRRLVLANVALAAFLCGAGGCVSAGPRQDGHLQNASPAGRADSSFVIPTLEELPDTLRIMASVDQAARNKLRNAPDGNTSIQAELREVDQRNTARMKAIVGKYGWPTHSMVGKSSSDSAWLLVQHADLDVAFQEKCLPLLEEALKKQDVFPANVAYLTDRILVNRGKPQVYGTQFHIVDGNLQPRPIENPQGVEKRRKQFGLSSLAKYREMVRT